jgi:hypothetical protein
MPTKKMHAYMHVLTKDLTNLDIGNNLLINLEQIYKKYFKQQWIL